MAMNQPKLVGRNIEIGQLKHGLEAAMAGKGSTVFVSGEAGIGKTRLVTEFIREAEANGCRVIRGSCLAENMEPLMPVKTALREAGLLHLMSGDPPPLVVSAYIINEAGLLMAKAERTELGLNPFIFSAMLKVVDSFVQDSMRMFDSVEKVGGMNMIGFQDYKILLEQSGGLHLACVIKGSLSEFLVNDMRNALAEILANPSSQLKDWDGDTESIGFINPVVARLVTGGKYDGKFIVDDPEIRQENLFDTVLLGLQRISADKPLLFFLDDIQWADPSTLGLLHYLARNTRQSRIMVIGAYRPEDIIKSWDGKPHHLETAIQNLSTEDLLVKVELNRLDRNGTEFLICNTLGSCQFESMFFKKIFKETEGTPFFILEVVKLLAEEGAIKQDAKGVWKLTTDLRVMDIPSKVYDVVGRRLDRLMEDQRRILDCASVIGEEFESEILSKVTGMGKLHLLENLNQIEKRHKLIYSSQKKYKFDHAKIREVLYNSLMDELKQEYHKLVADAIAELHAQDIDDVAGELAYHYFKANDDKAREYLVKAGDKATEKFENEEAIEIYEKSLSVIPEKEKPAIYEKLAQVQALTGNYEQAISNLLKINELAQDMETKARMLRKVSELHHRRDEYPESLAALEEAKRYLPDGSAEHGRISQSEGLIYRLKGDFDKALVLFKSALNTFEGTGGKPEDIGDIFIEIGYIHWLKGEYEQALDYYQRSLSIMKDSDDQYGIATALNNIGNVHHKRGELDKALECHSSSLEKFERIGDKRGIALSLHNIGIVHLYNGHLDKASEFYLRGLEMFEKTGNKWGVMHSLCGQAETNLGLGQPLTSLEMAERALAIAIEIGAKGDEGMSRRILGMAYRDNKDWEKAESEFERAKAIIEYVGEREELAILFYQYGLFFECISENEKAREHIEKALSEFERMGMKLWAEKCRKALGEL